MQNCSCHFPAGLIVMVVYFFKYNCLHLYSMPAAPSIDILTDNILNSHGWKFFVSQRWLIEDAMVSVATGGCI